MTTTMSTPPRSWGRCEDKIDPEHRDRAAIVYVRQSSRQQVLEHGESTRLQYALADRAVALGWARSRVTVIDDDLGVSAAVADARARVPQLRRRLVTRKPRSSRADAATRPQRPPSPRAQGFPSHLFLQVSGLMHVPDRSSASA